MLVIFCLLFIVALSWGYLLTGAGMMQEMGDMLIPMTAGPWTFAHGALVFVVWSVLMVAMMLPSAAPMVRLFTTIARRRSERGGRATGSGTFALGYMAVWMVFGAAARALQFGIKKAALLSPTMQTTVQQ